MTPSSAGISAVIAADPGELDRTHSRQRPLRIVGVRLRALEAALLVDIDVDLDLAVTRHLGELGLRLLHAFEVDGDLRLGLFAAGDLVLCLLNRKVGSRPVHLRGLGILMDLLAALLGTGQRDLGGLDRERCVGELAGQLLRLGQPTLVVDLDVDRAVASQLTQLGRHLLGGPEGDTDGDVLAVQACDLLAEPREVGRDVDLVVGVDALEVALEVLDEPGQGRLDVDGG